MEALSSRGHLNPPFARFHHYSVFPLQTGLHSGVLLLTVSVVFEQGGCPKVSLLQKVSCPIPVGHHAVLRQANEDRTAAALHPSAAQTLPCKQVCLCSVFHILSNQKQKWEWLV